LQRHLDRDRPLPEIVERKPGEKRIRREAIGVDHAPPRVAEMLIHLGKDGIDFGFGPRRHLVGVVRIPEARMIRVKNDMAVRCGDLAVAQSALPPVGLGDRASEVRCHDG
jgi:hypothetical protein